jgi:hypothetical protein
MDSNSFREAALEETRGRGLLGRHTYEETWLLDKTYNMGTSRDEEKKTAFHCVHTSFQDYVTVKLYR